MKGTIFSLLLTVTIIVNADTSVASTLSEFVSSSNGTGCTSEASTETLGTIDGCADSDTLMQDYSTRGLMADLLAELEDSYDKMFALEETQGFNSMASNSDEMDDSQEQVIPIATPTPGTEEPTTSPTTTAPQTTQAPTSSPTVTTTPSAEVPTLSPTAQATGAPTPSPTTHTPQVPASNSPPQSTQLSTLGPATATPAPQAPTATTKATTTPGTKDPNTSSATSIPIAFGSAFLAGAAITFF